MPTLSYICGVRVVFRSGNSQVANLHLLFATCGEFWFCVCRSCSYHLLFVAVLWVLSWEPYWLSSPEESSFTSISCIWAAVARSAAASASGVLRSAIPKAKPCKNILSVRICGPYVVTLANHKPIFEWYTAKPVVKNEIQRDMCYERPKFELKNSCPRWR